MRWHNKRVNVRIGLRVTAAFMLVAVANAEVPVTTNLLVNLNGDSTDNYLSSGGETPVVQLWKDLAEDGSDASQQDFGQAVAGRQPGLLANAVVPNSATTGINYNLLDFDRSVTLANNRNSGADSDTLKGKDATSVRPAAFGDPFTTGVDAAYEATNATGLSWFMVFRSSDQPLIIANNNLPSGSGSGGTTSRWGQQSPMSVSYANTATAGSEWVGTYLYAKGDGDTQINLSSHVRSINDNETHNDPNPVTTSNLNEATWYMMANSYDPTTGALRTVLTTPDGSGGTATIMDVTKNDPDLIIANGLGNGGTHTGTALGTFTGSTGSNNDWAFDGLMAEVLIYNAALTTTDLDSVATYLNNKYFVDVAAAPGDYNGDGFVDAADYVVWRKTDGENQAGYDAWRANFGTGNGASSALAAGTIPEPMTIWVLVIAAGLASLGIRRQRPHERS